MTHVLLLQVLDSRIRERSKTKGVSGVIAIYSLPVRCALLKHLTCCLILHYTEANELWPPIHGCQLVCHVSNHHKRCTNHIILRCQQLIEFVLLCICSYQATPVAHNCSSFMGHASGDYLSAGKRDIMYVCCTMSSSVSTPPAAAYDSFLRPSMQRTIPFSDPTFSAHPSLTAAQMWWNLLCDSSCQSPHYYWMTQWQSAHTLIPKFTWRRTKWLKVSTTSFTFAAAPPHPGVYSLSDANSLHIDFSCLQYPPNLVAQ